MTSRTAALLVTVLALVGGATAVRAHHSFAAAFDGSKPVTLTGKLVEVKYENPHSWFYIEVTDATGKVIKWALESSTPVSMVRAGIKREFFKLGDTVTIKGFHARDPEANVAAVREITLSDGRSFIIGPSDSTDHGESVGRK